MQENTESEKPEGSEVPEEAENNSEETPEINSSKSSDIDPEFEEHDREILPPEKKKNRGCGFLILIILLLTSGSGYLFYTDQVPTTAVLWIEPFLNKLNPPLATFTPQFSVTERSVPEVKEQSPNHAIEEGIPVSEKETVTKIAPSLSENQNEEHISGSQSDTGTKVIEPDNTPNISGASTKVDYTKMEQVKIAEEESKEFKETPVKEPAPALNTSGEPARDIDKPSQTFTEKPVQKKEKERNKGVQAYLDFFEASLLKLGELVKTGFLKGKDLLEDFLNKN